MRTGLLSRALFVFCMLIVFPVIAAAQVIPILDCNGLGVRINFKCVCGWGATAVDGTCYPGYTPDCSASRASQPHALRENRVYRLGNLLCKSNGNPSNHRYLFGQHHDHPNDLVGTTGIPGLGGSCNWQAFCDSPYTSAKECDYFAPDSDPNLWVSGPDAVSNITNIQGTDLGISVKFRDRTFIYFGDTWAQRPAEKYQCDPINGAPVECNDAIAVLDTCDPVASDGIDMRYVYWSGAQDTFLPLMIDGLHKDAAENYFGKAFNVPTGAATYKKGSSEYLMVFYATGLLNMTERRSWAACSSDGKTFTSCFFTKNLGYPPAPLVRAVPISYGDTDNNSKFLNVSPVWITKADFTAMSGDATSPFKSLLAKLGTTDGGMLLFGSGAYKQNAAIPIYRRGKVFMAYIDGKDIPDPGAPSLYPPKIYYYTGGTNWSNAQTDAAPVISDTQFGELSVKLIRSGVSANDPKLVMLYNTDAGVKYRKAKLRYAHGTVANGVTNGWTAASDARNSSMTSGTHQGYGPYIIDHYTKVASGKLYLYHTLSSWWGGESNSPYGVYTAETVIPWP